MIGARSLPGSYGSFGYITGLFTAVDIVVIMNVCPSAGAFTRACVPMMVLAPGIASTTTGCPKRRARRSAMVRVSTSIAPPGANGVMSLIWREGKSVCAAAAEATSAAAKAIRKREPRRITGLLVTAVIL